MIIKCKKIKNVDKYVCTAEQKIAYNYAFSYIEFGKKILKADTAEINKTDGFFQIENFRRRVERSCFKPPLDKGRRVANY